MLRWLFSRCRHNWNHSTFLATRCGAKEVLCCAECSKIKYRKMDDDGLDPY